MVYITGDLHGLKDAEKFKGKFFKNVVNKPGNILIIVGDAGFTWPGAIESVLEFFKNIGLKCKILSVLGNNDNYDDIYSREKQDYCGGKVVCVDGNTPEDSNIMYLMNGHIFDFEGKKYAVLGGADSYDAPFRCQIQKERHFVHPRTNHLSWWKEELPSVEDFERLEHLLKKTKVDFMLTHEATTNVVAKNFQWSIYDNIFPNRFCGKRTAQTKTVRDMNDAIDKILNCKMWFFGHHHFNKLSGDKGTPKVCIFDQFVDVNCLENIQFYDQNGTNTTKTVLNKLNDFDF